MTQPMSIEVPDQIRNVVLRILDHIAPGVATGFDSAHRFSVEAGELPVPPVVYWVLTEIVGCPDAGRGEKVAWQLALLIDDCPAVLALEKFGLRLYIGTMVPLETATELYRRTVAAIDKAVRRVEVSVLDPYFRAEVALGHVVIANQMTGLRSAYLRFRKLAASADVAASPSPEPELDDVAGLGRALNRLAEQNTARFHYSIAMINAYCSMLEHILVLIWPFHGYRPEKDNVQSFIQATLLQKFRTVFPQDAARAGSVYAELRELTERYRNTFDHGGFDKEGATVYVRLPGLGLVPSTMSQVRNSVHFDFFPVPPSELESMFAQLDGIDEFLESGPTARAVRFASQGFDVPFSEELLRPVRDAMASDADLEEYMRAESEGLSNTINMDW